MRLLIFRIVLLNTVVRPSSILESFREKDAMWQSLDGGTFYWGKVKGKAVSEGGGGEAGKGAEFAACSPSTFRPIQEEHGISESLGSKVTLEKKKKK